MIDTATPAEEPFSISTLRSVIQTRVILRQFMKRGTRTARSEAKIVTWWHWSSVGLARPSKHVCFVSIYQFKVIFQYLNSSFGEIANRLRAFSSSLHPDYLPLLRPRLRSHLHCPSRPPSRFHIYPYSRFYSYFYLDFHLESKSCSFSYYLHPHFHYWCHLHTHHHFHLHP